MCKLKSEHNNHIRHFPNHVNTLPYLVIYHNDKDHIHDVAKSQNNTHFITNNSFSVKTNVQSWTRLDRFSVTHCVTCSVLIHKTVPPLSKTIAPENKQWLCTKNNCSALKTKVTMVNQGRSTHWTLLKLYEL